MAITTMAKTVSGGKIRPYTDFYNRLTLSFFICACLEGFFLESHDKNGGILKVFAFPSLLCHVAHYGHGNKGGRMTGHSGTAHHISH